MFHVTAPCPVVLQIPLLSVIDSNLPLLPSVIKKKLPKMKCIKSVELKWDIFKKFIIL